MDPEIAIEGYGVPVRLSTITRNSQSRRAYLGPHHRTQAAVKCLCSGKPGIAMGVAHRKKPTETFYLYPLQHGDGARHNRACPHHEPARDAFASATRTKPTIERTDDTININLSDATYQAKQSSGSPNSSTPARSSTTAGRRGKLRTLLETVWHEAGLTEWSPNFAGKRHYRLIAHRLTEAVENMHINHVPIGDRFLAPPAYTPDRRVVCNRVLDSFLDAMKPRWNGRRHYGYVVGLLKEHSTDESEGPYIALAHLRLKIEATADRIRRVVNSCRFEPRETIVMACVEPGPHRNAPLVARGICAMDIADRESWIPTDSSHETTLIQRLVTEGRAFDKPISASDSFTEDEFGEGLRPDIVLRDTTPPYCMEVFGLLADSSYEKKAIAKMALYAKRDIPLWTWDTRDTMPSLPDPDPP